MPLVTVRQAVRILQEGGLVGMPTETVHGLAGLATNPESARQIYHL
ncbi:MAG TPA: Sua5/YciO/YrdC/YwlC family protein [Myxococcota bacterium]|nr:Sua5/YciO/YrdC/YwlC family protein [Myxococcota bacterium]